jgi:hypothetical protein
MKLPKTNNSKMIAWLLLGLIGYLINYFLIKPMMYDWERSVALSEDFLKGVWQLFIAEIFMLPALFVALSSLFQSVKDKKFVWTVIHLTGVLVISLLITYFALPIVFPSRGL